MNVTVSVCISLTVNRSECHYGYKCKYSKFECEFEFHMSRYMNISIMYEFTDKFE